MIRVLVTGSQIWPESSIVYDDLDEMLWRSKGSMTLVHGACKVGADAYAAAWARQRIREGFSIKVEPHPANWNGPKKKGAGFARNAEMVKLGADYCLAYICNDSHGASHTEKLAKKSGIATKTWRTYVGANDNNITIEGARIVFRNFAGKEEKYNREGNRNFSVVLNEQQADDLQARGWNVKRKAPKEEGDEPFNYLNVTVGFGKGRPPRIVMVTSRGRTTLDEDTCELLDYADIENVDMILRPYHWAVSGDTGTKAYLSSIYVTIAEDALERKYQDVPEIGRGGQRAIEQGYIDGEVISEEFD